MTKPRSDREIAEEIARKLSEDTPENAGMEVQSLLQCARDASGGALRADYLVKAQHAIARLEPTQNFVNQAERDNYAHAQKVASGLLSGEIRDPTYGANFFYSDNISPAARKSFDEREAAPAGGWRHLERGQVGENGVLGPFTFLKQPMPPRRR